MKTCVLYLGHNKRKEVTQMEEIYRVTFVDPDSDLYYIRRVGATGIIPAIQKAIDLDDTRWEVTKAEKEN